MNQISKEEGKVISGEILEAVTKIFEKHGMTAPKVSWGYGEYFKFTMTSSAIQEGLNGVNLASPEAQYYLKYGWSSWTVKKDGSYNEPVGLYALLGTLFRGKDNELFIFAGIDPKKKKFPVMATQFSTGKTFYMTEAIIPTINNASEQMALLAGSQGRS